MLGLMARSLRRTSPFGSHAPAASLVTTLLLALVLAGCGGDEPGGDSEEEPAVSPMTGLPFAAGEPPENPIIAVKVDNSDRSAPQLGLGSADMLVEEVVEGGITRLAAFFHTEIPATVGPVRSARASDIGVVQPLDAVLVASGGAKQTLERIKDAGIETFSEGAVGFSRDSTRSVPYNLFLSLDELAATLEAGDLPDSYLPFGADWEADRGRPASGVTVRFSERSSTTFRVKGGRYAAADAKATAGDEFEPDTVLALRVEVGDAGYRDPAGYPVPETRFTGRGEAVILHRGRVVRGDWVKDGLSAPVELVDQQNEPVALPPGKVWIGLVPANDGSVQIVQ